MTWANYDFITNGFPEKLSVFAVVVGRDCQLRLKTTIRVARTTSGSMFTVFQQDFEKVMAIRMVRTLQIMNLT